MKRLILEQNGNQRIDIKTPYTIDCTNLRGFCQEW